MDASTVPEIVQTPPQDIKQWRTTLLSSVTDLGPPDLTVLSKEDGKSSSSSSHPIETYFYQTGTNSTTVSSVVANLFDLTTALRNQLWFGKQRQFNVKSASYITYNCFSKFDVQVQIDVPGGVHWGITEQNGSHISSEDIPDGDLDQIWLETFTSNVVRSLITCDDEGEFAPIVEVRRLNPFADDGTVQLFLQGVETLFDQGPNLGCSDDCQLPSITNNYLIDALMKCIQITNCSDMVMPMLLRLNESHPECAFLIGKVMLLGDHEHQAVEFIKSKIIAAPFDANLLFIQSEYLLKKNKPQLALPLAIRAINCAPTDFKTWSHLVQVYISLDMFKDALLTLNSCPMVTHREKYTLKRITVSSQPNGPPPSDIHLPLPTIIELDGVTNLDHSKISKEQSQCPPDLLSLPAGNLKSTYKLAYNLLAELIKKLDWSKLLDLRAEVFVMEEELKNGSLNSKSKRMCERWLDNLFMLLYEDLKIFNLFKQNQTYQDAVNENQSKPQMGKWGYNASVQDKSALEWEIIGQVCYRLGHTRDAQRCFEFSLGQRFSIRSARSLLKMYNDSRRRAFHKQKDFSKFNKAIMDISMGLLAWEVKWYKFFSPKLLDSFQILGQDWGTSKLINEAPNELMSKQLESCVKLLVRFNRLEAD